MPGIVHRNAVTVTVFDSWFVATRIDLVLGRSA